MIDTIRTRRAELALEVEQGRAEYARIEGLLRDLDRSICISVGGLKILDELLAEWQSEAPAILDGGDGRVTEGWRS